MRETHICKNGYYQDDRLQVDRLQVEYWQRCGEKAIRVHYWWDCKLVQSLWRTASRFLKKLKMKLPYDPANLLLGICLKKMKTLIQKYISTPMLLAVLFTTVKI